MPAASPDGLPVSLAKSPPPHRRGTGWRHCAGLLTAALLAAAQALAAEPPAALERCLSCHTAAALAESPETPFLAGQPANYLFAAIVQLRSGQRPSSWQRHIPANLTDEEARAIADHFAALREAPPPQAVDAGRVVRGTALHFERCAACHQDEGRETDDRGLDAPRLAGQSRQYLATQLQDFAAGRRRYSIYLMRRAFVGDPLTAAGVTLQGRHGTLDAADLEALADFYASRGTVAPAAPLPQPSRRRAR